MKVGISYAVELEDIPEEVENLLRDVQWDLSAKIEELIVHLRGMNLADLEKDLKLLRSNLGRVDTRLEDCYTILVGYVNVLNGLAKKANETQTTAQVREISPGTKIISAPTSKYEDNG